MIQALRVLLSSLLISAVCALSSHSEASPEPEQESPQQTEWQETSRPTERPFPPLGADADILEQGRGRLRLRKLSSSTGYGRGVETERETLEENARTTRTVLRTYRRDSQGRRKLMEVVEDAWTKSSDGSERSVRTTSTTDVNRRMHLVARDTRETVPVGPYAFRTVTTFEGPGVESSLAPVERIVRTERRRGGKAIEIEQTESLIDPNGGWKLTTRRTGNIQEVGGVAKTDESIYRLDAVGRLSLSEQAVSLEWQESDGTQHRTIETRVPNEYGELEVVRELTIARTIASDGSSETVQETSVRVFAISSDALQVVERIVETDSPGGVTRQTRVEAADGTGQLRRVNSFKTVTTRSPDGKKLLRNVTGTSSSVVTQ